MKPQLSRYLQVLTWIGIFLYGFIILWSLRFEINPDGLSYLEIAEQVAKGDLSSLLNAYWSPGYAAVTAIILKIFAPSPFWERTSLAAASGVGLIFAVWAFLFLVKTLREIHRPEKSDPYIDLFCALVFSTHLFRTNSFNILHNTPDIFVVAFYLLACSLAARVYQNQTARRSWILLGFVLGLGYLFKTVLLPVSILFFLAFVVIACRHAARARVFKNLSLALSTFALIAVPYILSLSLKYDRFTYGESGKLNYSWYVNQTPPYYPAGPEIIFEKPTVYSFSHASNASWPLWLDPAAHLSARQIKFSPSLQIQRLTQGVIEVVKLLYQEQIILFWSLLMILAIHYLRDQDFRVKVSAHVPWVVISLLGIAMYIITAPVESRYIVPFSLVIWVVVLNSLRGLPTQKHLRWVVIGALLLSLPKYSEALQVSWKSLISSENPKWNFVQNLESMGLKRESKIAVLFWGSHKRDPYPHWSWTRYGDYQVAAEIVGGGGWLVPTNRNDILDFLSSNADTKRKLLSSLRERGIVAIVGWVPEFFVEADSLNWRAVPRVPGLHVLFLQEASL